MLETRQHDHEAVSSDILISMAGSITILIALADSVENYTTKSVSFAARSVENYVKRPQTLAPDLILHSNIYAPTGPIKVPRPLDSPESVRDPACGT